MSSANVNNKFMLFDLASGGHHPSYIKYLAEYWDEQKIPMLLNIVVSPDFLEKHYQAVNIGLNQEKTNIKFISLHQAEYLDLIAQRNLIIRTFKEWHLLNEYAKKLQASHCLIMFLDSLQIPLLLKPKLPCSFSAIYFRPTFHYKQFNNNFFSIPDIFRQWRQKKFLYHLLQNPQLKALFCLDPLAITPIQKLSSKSKPTILHLPDPVKIARYDRSKIETMKQRLQIDKNRKIFLLFGRLARRKGIEQLLQAIQLLPLHICQNLCLLLAGSIPSDCKFWVETRVAALNSALPVQIIIRDELIPDPEVPVYFHLADVILAPYQRHVGMSGILLWAAAAQKPVLSSNYGLMGNIVDSYELGLTIDSTKPHLIAQAIAHFMLSSPESLCNLAKMEQLAVQNSAENFSRTITTNILGS